MLREATFDTGAVLISYGEGPPSGSPIVMLHGISGWWKTFLPVIAQLHMPRISCPALLLRGEPTLGGAIEDDDERRALSMLRHAMVVRMAGVGHFIHSNKPEQYSRVVSDFLESLD
jgi:pimeloyl-ACP methyl ester carboxylesterase